MILIRPMIEKAMDAGLQSSIPSDPVSPQFLTQAGDYGLAISASVGAEFHDPLVTIMLNYGMSRCHQHIPALVVSLEANDGVYEMRYYANDGEDPPPAVRALAEKYGLTDPDDSVALAKLKHGQELEALDAFIALVVAEKRRLSGPPRPSTIPLPEFLAAGGRIDRP